MWVRTLKIVWVVGQFTAFPQHRPASLSPFSFHPAFPPPFQPWMQFSCRLAPSSAPPAPCFLFNTLCHYHTIPFSLRRASRLHLGRHHFFCPPPPPAPLSYCCKVNWIGLLCDLMDGGRHVPPLRDWWAPRRSAGWCFTFGSTLISARERWQREAERDSCSPTMRWGYGRFQSESQHR